MTDLYMVLGVSPNATQTEIAHAYRRHLRDHHPDTRHETPNSDADERLREILAAYGVLRDPRRRAEYDRAHPAHNDIGHVGPVGISVTHLASTDEQPPLWAGPVQWHR